MKTKALLLIRILLGAALFYAGFSKIKSAHEFAETIANFDLLPAAANQILAVVLPWHEIAAGLLLVFGVWVRASAIIATALFGAFTVAIVTALARGLDIECGCFGTDSGARVGVQTLLIDLVGLAMAVAMLFAPSPRPSVAASIS